VRERVGRVGIGKESNHTFEFMFGMAEFRENPRTAARYLSLSSDTWRTNVARIASESVGAIDCTSAEVDTHHRELESEIRGQNRVVLHARHRLKHLLGPSDQQVVACGV